MNMTQDTTNQLRDPERLDLPSASAMEIVQACPGQRNLLATLPPEAFQKPAEEDEWAKRGTRIHAAFETGNTVDLDEEELETYEQGQKFVHELLEKWIRLKSLPRDKVEEGPRELRVFLREPQFVGEPIGSGKLDRHWLCRERRCGLVVDFKTGWNKNLPPSNHSWQLRYQAVLLHREEYAGDIDEWWVAHCKPKDKLGADDWCVYQFQDLEYSVQSIQYHLWESTQFDAKRHAGDWCNWCPCKAWCPEAGAYAMLPSVIARRAAPEATDLEGMVQAMAPEDLLKLWEMDTVVRKILDAADERLKTFPKDELERLGLELPERGKERNTIVKVREAFDFLHTTQQFTEKDLWLALDLAVGKVAEIAMQEKSLTKANASKWVKEILKECISKTYDRPSLRKIKGL